MADDPPSYPGPGEHSSSEELRRRINWGVATASYQIEGAWDEGGRTPSVWDVFSHTPGKIENGDTGDVACDHYHKYEEDFALMEEMGIKHYRFSFSWNRLLPEGAAGTPVNPKGVAFYNKLIDAMLARGITPYATMFHWDLPQALQDKYGGLMGEQFVEDFAAYARVLFESFGDRVKHWMTFNEPWVICVLAYGDGNFAPGIPYGDEGRYRSAHHLLLAHATVAALYRSEYKEAQGGRLGIVLNTEWKEPWRTGNAADAEAARRALDQDLGWFIHPLFTGDYPEEVKRTRLVPEIGAEMRALLLDNPLDFIGLNLYTASYVLADDSDPLGFRTTPLDPEGRPIGDQGQSWWLRVVPWAIYKLVKHVDQVYNRPEILITENGASAPGEADMPTGVAVRDEFRLNYYRGYIDQLCKAVEEGANVSTYFAWSFLDNFEWRMGYTERFGIVAVDFKDPSRARTVKDSGRWLSEHFFKFNSDA